MDIVGKVFVVTGGGNGIGREVVLALLRRGARGVAAVDLREDSLAELTALVERMGSADRLSTHALSVADADAVAALPDAVIARHGQVDGVLNVAGIIQPFVPVAELERSMIEKVMNVNFWGVVNVSTAFLPALLARPSACLINVSSMGALTPVPGQSVYGASKAAVKAFTEGLYAELRGTSVAVTVVFPGGVATDIAGNSGAAVPGAHSAEDSKMAKFLTTPPAAAARMLHAIETGPFRLTIGKDARAIDLFSRMTPRRSTEVIATQMAKMM